jgi:hypothetical protein
MLFHRAVTYSIEDRDVALLDVFQPTRYEDIARALAEPLEETQHLDQRFLAQEHPFGLPILHEIARELTGLVALFPG